ncbi:nuclear transport factor 2 family protein [Sinomicrobium sp. M5D2P17]
MNTNVETVLLHHLTAFGNNDLDAILEDYTENSIIFTPEEIITGLANIRIFFKDFFSAVPTGSVFGMKQRAIEGDVAFIVWSSESSNTKIPLGTDTFVFNENKIQYHTVADYRIKK